MNQYMDIVDELDKFEILDAYSTLSDIYFYGKDIVKDEFEGAKWYAKGAELGDSYCQYKLACCCEHSKGGLSCNTHRASMLHWYQESAVQGCFLSKVSLAKLHMSGADDSVSLSFGDQDSLVKEAYYEQDISAEFYADFHKLMCELYLRNRGGISSDPPLALYHFCQFAFYYSKLEVDNSVKIRLNNDKTLFNHACTSNHVQAIGYFVQYYEFGLDDLHVVTRGRCSRIFLAKAAEHGKSMVIQCHCQLSFDLLYEFDAFIEIDHDYEDHNPHFIEGKNLIYYKLLHCLLKSGDLMRLVVDCEWDGQMAAVVSEISNGLMKDLDSWEQRSILEAVMGRW